MPRCAQSRRAPILGQWPKPVALRCHPLTQWAFMLLATQASIEAHSGYNVGLGRALEAAFGRMGVASWSVHHDNHHRAPRSNFEPFFTYLDRLCGSLYVSSNVSKVSEQ